MNIFEENILFLLGSIIKTIDKHRTEYKTVRLEGLAKRILPEKPVDIIFRCFIMSDAYECVYIETPAKLVKKRRHSSLKYHLYRLTPYIWNSQ